MIKANPLMTMQDVCAYTQMSERSVRRAIERGDLSPVIYGTFQRFRQADVDAMFVKAGA